MGQWAARLTCLRIEQFFFDEHPIDVDTITQLVSEIDWELRGEGRGAAACTLSILWLHGHEAAAVHVGDSAIYRLRDNDISRITKIHGGGRGLHAFMGMGPNINEVCQVVHTPLRSGDVFLLVTDGVSDFVSPPELAAAWVCSGGDPDRCAASILQKVSEREGNDDATVVVVQFLSDGSRERVSDPTNAPDIPARMLHTR